MTTTKRMPVVSTEGRRVKITRPTEDECCYALNHFDTPQEAERFAAYLRGAMADAFMQGREMATKDVMAQLRSVIDRIES